MFDYDINKLIISEIETFNRIGWFFYNRDLENGLTKDDVDQLLRLLIEEEKVMESELEESYKEGFNDAFE